MAHVTKSHSFHLLSQYLQCQTEMQPFYLHPYLFENFYSSLNNFHVSLVFKQMQHMSGS